MVTQSCLCDPMDYSPPGFSVHGFLQARILEWVAIPFCRGSLTQGSNLCLLHWQADSWPMSPLERPLHWVKVLMTLYNCRQCAQPLQFCFSLLNNLLSTFLHKSQNCHHCLLQLFPTIGPSRYFQVLAIIQLCLKQCDPNCTFFLLAFKFLFNFILYWSIATNNVVIISGSNDFWVTVTKLVCSSQGPS